MTRIVDWEPGDRVRSIEIEGAHRLPGQYQGRTGTVMYTADPDMVVVNVDLGEDEVTFYHDELRPERPTPKTLTSGW